MLELLRSEFEKRQKKNAAYSIRSFARTLDIHPSSLSAILARRRPLTPKIARKLFDQLDIPAQKRNRLILETLHGGLDRDDNDQVQLKEEVLEIITGWEHFAILALLQIAKPSYDPRWIAQRLNISVVTVNGALERLIKHGLLARQGKKLVVTHKSLTTTHDVPSAALRRANQQYIEKALYSLENHSVEERDITGITLSVSKNRIPEAKAAIKEFRRQMSELLEGESKDEVYRLNVQLFPIKK